MLEVRCPPLFGGAPTFEPRALLVQSSGAAEGFEPGISRAVSGAYAATENALQSSSQPPVASVHVFTETVGGDTENDVTHLPTVTPELFLEAGLIVAERASRKLADVSLIEDLLRQAVQQATASGGTRRRP
jgi:hypothetical protein